MAGDVPDAPGADEGLDPFSFYYKPERSAFAPIGTASPSTVERVQREKYHRPALVAESWKSRPHPVARLKLVRTGTTDVVGTIPSPDEIHGHVRHFSVENDRRLTTAEGLRHDPYENPFGPVPSSVRHFVLCYGLVTFDGGWTLERVLEVPPGFEMSLLEGIEGWQTSSS